MPHDLARPGPEADSAAARLIRRASYASVVVASVLIVTKLVAWIVTDSISMLSTLIDSVLDAAASLLNMVAIRAALTPPDAEHRFGHGKAESLSALGQSAFIFGSALFLSIEAVERLVNPEPIRNSDFGIAVMVISILLTAALVLYQRSVLRRVKSTAIAADNLHYVGDLLSNLAVIVALLITARFAGLSWIDPVLGFVIAGIILAGAWKIGRAALNELMDRELPDEQRAQLIKAALSHADVLAVHDLRTRNSGRQTFIQVHIEMDGALPLRDAHGVADWVERRLAEMAPNAEVIVHQDPYEPDSAATERIVAAPD